VNPLITRAIELFDLLGYVIDHGGEEAQVNQWALVCPTCGKKKLVVDLGRRAWHCWVCEQYGAADARTGKRQVLQGAGGLIDLVQFLEGWDRKRAAEFVLAQTNLQPPNLGHIDGDLRASVAKELDGLRTLPQLSCPECTKKIDGAMPYMVQRGISMEDVRMFGLFYCDGGRYRGRLIFPVYEDGRLVYFQGRAMWESKEPGFLKSLNPVREEGAGVSSEVLFNLDQARFAARVAITEGPIDAVHVGPDAVCTFGKKISATQIAKMLRAGVKAVDLIWDGPSEREPQGAWPEMFAVAPTLATLFDTRLVFVPQKDPGSWSRAENAFFRTQGRPVSSFAQVARL
jgi:hypothetical protein